MFCHFMYFVLMPLRFNNKWIYDSALMFTPCQNARRSLYIAYQIFLNPHASQLQRRNTNTYARRARPAIYVLVYQFTDTTTNTSIARAHVKEISRWYSSQKHGSIVFFYSHFTLLYHVHHHHVYHRGITTLLTRKWVSIALSTGSSENWNSRAYISTRQYL